MFRFFAFTFCALLSSAGWAVVSDFEDKSLPSNSFYNGSDLAGGFESRGAHYSNSHDSVFGSWSGFGYSNVNNTTTAGFTNQYAAITGSGFGGSGIYGMMSDFGAFGPPNVITLPHTTVVESMRVTNSVYAYLAIRDGNDGFGAVRQFGDDPGVAGSGNQGFPDWFKLTITGRTEAGQTTGAVEFFLADYRFASNLDDYVLSTWELIDLTSLGSIRSMTFSLSSSDVGAFGMNTPGYVALDNISFIPEPQMVMLLVLGLGLTRRR